MDLDLGAINRADNRTEGQGQTGIVPAHNARALAAGESEGGQVYALIAVVARGADFGRHVCVDTTEDYQRFRIDDNETRQNNLGQGNGI